MQPVSQPVSIVVTVLNEAADIGRVVHSLLTQTPVPAEVIVVDGGSSDGTWEWLAATQAKDTRLVAIRDETCSLKYSAGPVSRGRNVAIAAAASGIIATADAGCIYAPDWAANLTAPLIAGTSEYALGGSCLDPADHTLWDLASAPFFSIKLGPGRAHKILHRAFHGLHPRALGAHRRIPRGRTRRRRHALRLRRAPADDARIRRERQGPLPSAKHLPLCNAPTRPLRRQRRTGARAHAAPVSQRRDAAGWSCWLSRASGGA